MDVSSFLFWLAALIFFLANSVFAEEGGIARTFRWNTDGMDLVKQRWLEGYPCMSTATVDVIIRAANSRKNQGPFSVVYDDAIPPGGDKHDYLSYGYYWWPNPDTNDGLPWIRRDGYGNPNSVGDGKPLSSLRLAAIDLSLAYYITDDESYAEHMADLLRVFFLDEETKMNPRCLYSQVIPGVEEEGHCAVVDFSNTFRFILEAAGILERSPHWTATDKQGLQQWCMELFNFYETEICDCQRDNLANHGTNYDFLTALLAMYAGENDLAKQKIVYYIENRMSEQIDADGSQPREMSRANNFMYSCYNLGIIFDIACLSEHFPDIDLWNYELEDGRGPWLALEFLIPYMTGEEEWTFWPGEAFSLTPERYFKLLRIAALGYDNWRYERLIQKVNYDKINRDYYNIAHPHFAITTVDSDIDYDGDVDLYDFQMLALAWLSSSGDDNWSPVCDISDPKDGVINMLDLGVFSSYWLEYL